MAGLFPFAPLLGVLTEPLAVLLSRSYFLYRSYMRVVSVALALTLLSSGFVCAQQSTVTQQQLLDTAQLDQLVAPIALYPDPLPAQVSWHRPTRLKPCKLTVGRRPTRS